MTPSLSSARLLDSLARDVEGFRSLAAAVPPDAEIPGCPGWTVHALVGHLGSIHRWATSIVRSGGSVEEEPPPDLPFGDLVRWFGAGADALLRTLNEVGPDHECWTFGPRPRQAGFWIRRQAHETALHHWDLRSACGPAGPVDPVLAADGVDEVVTMFFPRQVRLGRIAPPGDIVQLVVDETGRRWSLGGDAARPAGVDDPPGATVTGPADQLLLLLWRRLRLDDAAVTLTGDRRVAARVFATALTP